MSANGANAFTVAQRNHPMPDALALAGLAYPVHAVVPVARAEQRNSVLADREALAESKSAVLEVVPRCSETLG